AATRLRAFTLHVALVDSRNYRSGPGGRVVRHQATSSVQTLKLTSVFGPNVWVIGTSDASRPWAINIRPIRGTLLRGSNVCQRPPTKASNQPAKSPGP